MGKKNRPKTCDMTLTNLKPLAEKKTWFFWPQKSTNAPIREFKPLNNECTVQKTCSVCQEKAPVILPAWSSCH
jgi:hypothetical protein